MITGRVIEVHRTNFIVKTNEQEITATVRGSFHDDGEFPKVGDYVSYTLLDDGQAVIETVHERSSLIKRKAPSSDEEQIMVTNVALIYIVMGLDGDFSISRLERYLVLAAQSAIPAVIVLNKADVTTSQAEQVAQVTAVAGSYPVCVVSALTGDGMEQLTEYVTPDTTAVLLGSSGAGKSTITNWLLGEERQAVKSTRTDDNRGRHTTTSRQLFALPSGGFLIDTPGMRELGAVEDEQSAELIVFQKIEALAADCKFRNCDHEKSAGCAVLVALESGELSEREYQNFQKILREQEFLARKDMDNGTRYESQNQKRAQQKSAAALRARLSRGRRP